MKAIIVGTIALIFPIFSLFAQEVVQESVTPALAEVISITHQEERVIPGTTVRGINQTLEAKILSGDDTGKIVVAENDYTALKKGEKFYLMRIQNELDGSDWYTVSGPYRIPAIAVFIGLFLLTVFAFGGKQGIRGIIALIGSIVVLMYVLIPGILAGYSPLLLSMLVASVIVVLGSYITHGFNRTTSAAVFGMIVTILITGILSALAVWATALTGVASEEAVYLNFNTSGSIDLSGLLLGSILIGLLGVLYDAAIGQAIAVEELFSAGTNLGRREVYRRAIRIGREHVGALVNTLAIAYVGAALPLLLLYATSTTSIWFTINQEVFATEIIRTVVGSVGVILAIPITTLISVYTLFHLRQVEQHTK